MSWLVTKISRGVIDKKIAPYTSNEKTLEVGSHGKPRYGRFFPDRVGIDVQAGSGVDIVASVYELPFADAEFSNVLCMSVLEHLEEPSRAIAEMRRVLKPGGRIIVSVPFLFPVHDAPGDYWRFTKYGLQYLFRDGWDVLELSAETDTQRSFADLLQRLGYQTKMRANAMMKVIIHGTAKLLQYLPSPVTAVFGNIQKTVRVDDAFASAFFFVATKKHEPSI